MKNKFMILINEEVGSYLQWKRKNVTLRGIEKFGQDNNVHPMFGKGLYTVPLSNKKMAKQYGDVYFVVNAIPKNPKIVDSLNDAELVLQNLVDKFCKKLGVEYDLNYFEKHTSMEDEMMALGYDGLIIKGREMVNYFPDDVRYFENEQQLKSYYESLVN